MVAAHDTERPPNRARAIFHVVSALCCLALTLVVLTPRQLLWAAIGFAVLGWSLETIRRVWPSTNDGMMAFFGPVAHASERDRINSSTWYVTALVPLAASHSTLVCVVAVAVLGFGDPAAAWVGRRWGRIRVGGRRTLEGTLAFVFVAGAFAWGFVQLLPQPPPLGLGIAVALVGATAGAIAELVSRRVDDNFSIPIAAGAAAAGVLAVSGYPLS